MNLCKWLAKQESKVFIINDVNVNVTTIHNISKHQKITAFSNASQLKIIKTCKTARIGRGVAQVPLLVVKANKLHFVTRGDEDQC